MKRIIYLLMLMCMCSLVSATMVEFVDFNESSNPFLGTSGSAWEWTGGVSRNTSTFNFNYSGTSSGYSGVLPASNKIYNTTILGDSGITAATNDYTWAFWYYPTTLGGAPETIGDTSEKNLLRIDISGDQTVFYCHGNTNSNDGGIQFNTNVWYFIVIRHNASQSCEMFYTSRASTTTLQYKSWSANADALANGLSLGGSGDNNNAGQYDRLMIFNEGLTNQEIHDIFNYGSIDEAAPPSLEGILVNITSPNESQRIGLVSNYWVNVTTNVTSSCTLNDTRWSLNSWNASNTTWFFTNNTAIGDGDQKLSVNCTTTDGLNGSDVRTFTVDTMSPNISIEHNNFFNSSNNTVLNGSGLATLLLNITFTDNLQLLAFEVNITNSSGFQFFNNTNNSLSGLVYNYTDIIDISAITDSGYFTAHVSVWDSHTDEETENYNVKDGLGRNYIEFNDDVKITAKGAYRSKAEKQRDRYTFEFDYVPIVVPSTKEFYLESASKLIYLQDSSYQAHFIVWNGGDNSYWVDFEGIDDIPIIEKINDNKYKITFKDKNTKVKFKSIGGLNRRVENFEFFVDIDNPYINLVAPTSELIPSNKSVTVKVNVTDEYRNTTYFTMWNSTGTVTETNYTYQGNGSFLYNHTFNNLESPIYWINITHYDQQGYNNQTNVTLYTVSIDNCTSYSTVALNFTTYDEENQSVILADWTWNFNYTHDQVGYKTYTSSMDSSTNLSICIYPSNASINAEYTIYYEGDAHPQRRYYESGGTLTNSSISIPLYLLHASFGIYARFRVVDSYSIPIPGVSATMQRVIGGSLVTIEQEETDDSGLATFWVNPDEDYTFTFSKAGYSTYTATLRPTTTEIYTIQLGSGGTENVYSSATGLRYEFKPDSLLNNATLYNFSFNLTSSYWPITWCGMWLNLPNGTIISQSNSSYDIGYCNITIPNINTSNFPSIISEIIYELNGSNNITISNEYKIGYYYEGNFSLQNFLDDITSFSDAGFNDFTRMFLAFIMILVITALASMWLKVYDPDIIIPVVLVMIWFFSYTNWLVMNYDAIPDIAGLKQYLIAYLCTLGGLAYIIRRHI